MKFTLTIDPTVTETVVSVIAREIDDNIRAIQQLTTHSGLRRLVGSNGREVTLIHPRAVLAFYTKDKNVWAHTASGEWQLKARLFEIEDDLPPEDFVRISQSEIVNIAAIKNLDLSMTGTISVRLKDDSKYFVSRRQLKTFKAKLGL